MGSFNYQMTGSADYNLQLNVAQTSQNVAGNYSTVAWNLIAMGSWGSYGYYSTNWSVNIGGVGRSGSIGSFNPNPSQMIASGSVTIGHNANGTKSIWSSGYWDSGHSSIGAGNPQGPDTLTTIPRASTSTWAVQGTKYMGQTYQINTNRASTGFTHTITYHFGNATGTIATGVGASVNWTIPESLLSQIPNAASGTGTITTTTFSGGSNIGSRNSSITLTAPTTAIPTWTSVSASEGVPDVATKVGAYVQGISKISYSIVGAAGVSGSTISEQKYQVEGQTLTGATGTTVNPITGSGTVPSTFTITDTRGRQKTQVTNLTILPYVPPLINSYSVDRALSDGTADPDDGTYLKVSVNANVQSLINGTQKNSMILRVYTKLRTEENYNLSHTVTPAGISYNNSFVVTGPFLVDQSYDVRVAVVDIFNTSPAETTIAVASVFMHWGSGLGVGKYHENGMLDVGGDVYATGSIYPSGIVVTDKLSHIGTTAERDAYFGTLTTDAEKVALANRMILWFNTDLGWEESYYAQTGTSGLTVRGLNSPHSPGWYPVGDGPRLLLAGGAGQTMTANQNYVNWYQPGTDRSFRNGTPDQFIDWGSPGYAFTYIAGRYNASLSTYVTNGSGTAVLSFRANLNPGTAFQTIQKPIPLLSSFGQVEEFHMRDLEMPAGGLFFERCDSGSLTINGGWSELSVKYIGPPLVGN